MGSVDSRGLGVLDGWKVSKGSGQFWGIMGHTIVTNGDFVRNCVNRSHSLSEMLYWPQRCYKLDLEKSIVLGACMKTKVFSCQDGEIQLVHS